MTIFRFSMASLLALTLFSGCSDDSPQTAKAKVFTMDPPPVWRLPERSGVPTIEVGRPNSWLDLTLECPAGQISVTAEALLDDRRRLSAGTTLASIEGTETVNYQTDVSDPVWDAMLSRGELTVDETRYPLSPADMMVARKFVETCRKRAAGPASRSEK